MKTFLMLLLSIICLTIWAEENSPKSKSPTKDQAAAPPPQPPKMEIVFQGEADKIKKQVEALFDHSRKVSDAKETKARSEIEGALDWDQIAKDCIGQKRWNTLVSKNKIDFRSLLKEVIVRTAYSRMKDFWTNTSYAFQKIDVKGNTSRVLTEFTAKGEPFLLEYFMYKKGSKWSIYDISFEDLRYSININEQIDSFLKEKTFANLIEKLKKRRDDLVEDEKKRKKR